MSDRIFSLLVLAVAAAYAVTASGFQIPFQYEPVGPKAWPMILATVAGLCALYLLVRPDPEPRWGHRRFLRGAAVSAVFLLAYAWAFEWFGFIITTALVSAGFCLLFGGRWRDALAAGAGFGLVGYLVFAYLLQLNLPEGRIFAG